MPELLDAIIERLPSDGKLAVSVAPEVRFALIGRPNAGKSSLFNRLAGYERTIVADRPGTTRDPIDLRLEANGHVVLMVDTAGIRRPARVEGELEHHSVGRAIETIRRAEVLALVVDANEGITDQDARLARLAENEGRALIVVCSKWDLAAAAGQRIPAFVRQAYQRFPFLEVSPLLFTSAVTGDGVNEIVPAVIRAGAAWKAKFQTAELNRILAEAIAAMDPPLVAGRRLKLMYVTQVASAPPRLAIFSNLERDIPSHYARFIVGRFRAALGIENAGIPLRLEFRRAQSSAHGHSRIKDW
jgi:GTP-binding protein